MKRLIEAHLAGRNDEAARIHQRLMPVINTLMTTAANPVPLKSVINALGFPAGPFRLPLVALTGDDLERVLAVVRGAGDLVTFEAGAHVG
jgi:4-hydroxy-tetrahydrodipicolinate synthase